MKQLPILFSALCFMMLFSCTDKRGDRQEQSASDSDSILIADTTLYGRCADAAMHSFSLITEQGDTIPFLLEAEDTIADVQGGLYDGDRLAVVAQRTDGEHFAQKVINITSLCGRWISIDKNFEIKDDGIVESQLTAESNPYTAWSIFNGQLLLNNDTFNIQLLSPDSLYLENRVGIFTYKRM